MSDALKIVFGRTNLGPNIRDHLRSNAHLLDNDQATREGAIEWNRFEDIDAARRIGHQPMDIGMVG